MFAGGGAVSVPVEQWVSGESDRGEPDGSDADHVPGVVPRLEGALESGNLDARLQRTEDIHGDERNAVWRADCQLQARGGQVSDGVLPLAERYTV